MFIIVFRQVIYLHIAVHVFVRTIMSTCAFTLMFVDVEKLVVNLLVKVYLFNNPNLTYGKSTSVLRILVQ